MMSSRWLHRLVRVVPLRSSRGTTQTSESLVLVSLSYRNRRRELSTTIRRAANPPVVFETEIRDGVEYKVPLAKQHMKELLAGRFPTNHPADAILLKDLPPANFRGIVNAFDASNNSERKTPSGHVYFDRKFSKISAHRAPTTVHEAAIHDISDSVLEAIRARVPERRLKFFVRTNANEQRLSRATVDFTTKIPDFMLSYIPTGAQLSKPIFLAEVGFSESYDSLSKTMRYWLESDDEIKLAFLVKFTESPRYNTRRILQHIPQDVLDNPERYLSRSLVHINNREGRLEIHGSTFVGRTTAFVEIWKREAETGKAMCRGDRIYFYDSSLPNHQQDLEELSIDFDEFGIHLKELQGENISIDWKDWAASIDQGRRELAWDRFRRFLVQKIRERQEGNDGREPSKAE